MILDQLKTKQIEYMKAKEEHKLSLLRLLISQINYKAIELRPQNIQLTDEQAYKVLKKLIKQKNEAIELCKQSGRVEAEKAELAELSILEDFVSLFPAEVRIN